MMVESSFNIEEVDCKDLKNDVYQLGIILHPPEYLNEKFLIRLRDCVLSLSEEHPLKRWMKWVAKSPKLSKEDQEKQNLINEIVNTQFNLITDPALKNKIIKILNDIPENTVAEQVLRSYFYLMIGNITRSDNILRSVIKTPPIRNWEKHLRTPSLYHRLATEHFDLIVKKIAKHPADRRTVELFSLYFSRFYNQPDAEEAISQVDTEEIESKLSLKFIEGMAPEFVHFLRLTRMSEGRRFKQLRDYSKFSLHEQAYWTWAFMDIDPLISESMVDELVKIEKDDELWFIYLMNDEKLADLFSRKQKKSFLPGRRHFLKASLQNEKTFMLSLYKLIELGDINPDLIETTTRFLTHE